MTSPAHFSLLVVDDEPDLRTLYELTLLREGYRVDAAGTLAEAWEQLRAKKFDAVITDMRLPDGLGLELLRSTTDWLRLHGADYITGVVQAPNIPIQRLLERLGFLSSAAHLFYHKWFTPTM